MSDRIAPSAPFTGNEVERYAELAKDARRAFTAFLPSRGQDLQALADQARRHAERLRLDITPEMVEDADRFARSLRGEPARFAVPSQKRVPDEVPVSASNGGLLN